MIEENGISSVDRDANYIEYFNKPDPSRGQCFIEYCGRNADAANSSLGEILWRGRQWAVTEDGIECLNGKYFIDKSRLAQSADDKVLGWPWHMGCKRWVDGDDFATAWLVGLALYGYRVDSACVREAISVMPPQNEFRT